MPRLCYRAVLYDGSYPGWLQFGYFTAWAAMACSSVGLVGLQPATRPGLAEEL